MVEQNQLITAMLHNVASLQRQINSGHQLTEAKESRKNSHKKNENLRPRKKYFKPSHLLKQQRQLSQVVIEHTRVLRENLKEPLKCWGCEGPHLRRNCPLVNRNEGQVPRTQEAETMGQKVGIIPKISTVLEDHQEGHNSTMVEVEGEIAEHTISALIDPRSTHNYITPRLVELCTLKNSNHRRSWFV